MEVKVALLAQRSFYFLAFFFSIGTLSAQSDLDYGLAFASHEVTKDFRTSLSLNPEEPFYVHGDFEIKFDISFQRLTNAYGYIVRAIANDSLNIDLMSSPEHSEFQDLNLIINNQKTDIHFDYKDVGLKPDAWTKVSITFSAKSDLISVTWNGKKKSQHFATSQFRTVRLFFGAHEFGKFRTPDSPPVSLRDIEILDRNEVVLKWDLKNHRVNEIYDTKLEHKAIVTNPHWLIDSHTKWVHRKDFVVGKYPSVAFDKNTSVLYAIDQQGVYTYDVRTGTLENKDNKNGNSIYTDANQLLYIEETRQLINYDVLNNKISSYNNNSRSWSNTDTKYHEPSYWHNNKFYNPADSALYSFGGYGFFTYKNDFFKYDSKQQAWEKVKTSGATIPPRYLGASGLTSKKDKVLIFGGYGSPSGKQELSPQSFYDLYSFNLGTREIKKIWDFGSAHSDADVVFSNSLVLNEKDSCFYVLTFPKNKYESYITLRQYSLNKPEFKVLADSIPFRFHDEHSFSDLFLSEVTKELIAVTSHKENDQYKVTIYSINYPPLSPADVTQPAGKKAMEASLYYLVLFLVGIGGLGLYWWMKKIKKPKSVSVAPEVKELEHEALSANERDAQVINGFEPEEKVLSTIYLFGGLQVFDQAGHDITGKFTMTLKEIFVLILLHSIKYEQGISTTVLQEYLWPDKDEVSARNNRNVNIKKLRTLLEELGDITIENNNSYLRLAMGNNVFCDYQTVVKILSHHQPNDEVDRKIIGMLIKNVKRGSLLPNLQIGWLDGFKSDISNQVIDTLLEFSQKLDVNKDDKELLEIADAIFNYDSINQEALVIKCSVLNRKGKYSLARNWYDHFAKEYKNLYSENYLKSFEEVIS